MEYTHKISICMMVKNEEKNLQRCLDSIQVLLENPLVELIIVDTGSTDNTVNIAKIYTPNVYFHEWNNHFSDMRNITMSYARGEWIFILDADECLENPDIAYETLIDQNWATYYTIQVQVKSYTGENQEDDYSLLPQPRFFRNDGSFRYEGTVHNQPIFKSPVLVTDIILGHYGYVFSDKELMETKFQRTATILKEELEKDPNNIYYQFQLATSYSMYNDDKMALLEVRKAYEMIKKRPKKEKVAYSYMYGMYVRTSLKNNQLDETVRVCKEGIGLQPEYLDLYFILANALLKTGERTEAIENFKKYNQLIKKYGQLSVAKNPAFIMYNLDSKSQDLSNTNIALYDYDYERYKEAYKYLQKIKEKSLKNVLMCKTLIKIHNYKELKRYYHLIEDEDEKNQFIGTLETELANLIEDEKNEIAHLFKDNDDAYGLLNRIKLDTQNKEQLIKQFFNQYDINSLPVYYGKVLTYLQDNIHQLITYFKKMNNAILGQHIALIMDECKDIKNHFKSYILETNEKVRNNDYQTNRVYAAIANVILMKEMEEAKSQNKALDKKDKDIFILYLEKGFNCLEYIYDMRKIRIIYHTLDIKEDKFLMIMYLAKKAIDKENFDIAIRHIKEAVKQFPHMSMALQEYQKEVFKDI